MKIVDYAIHPEFSEANDRHDLAILTVDKWLPVNEGVSSICLPNRNMT